MDESKLVFIHGRIEDVTLPVEKVIDELNLQISMLLPFSKVDIIISEWMGKTRIQNKVYMNE